MGRYEDRDPWDLITAIDNYMAFRKSDFDDSFIRSLEKKLLKGLELGDSQNIALNRIVNGFSIDVDGWKD